jgi:bla regulator protein blaR1
MAFLAATKKRFPAAAWAVALSIFAAPHVVFAQTAAPTVAEKNAAKASFDVISIKPSSPNGMKIMIGFRYMPDGISGQSVNLTMLARAAYGGFTALPSDDSVIGLPDWAKTQMYDVEARMSEADATAFKALSKDDQGKRRQEMLQSLLEDRFQMKSHMEKKLVPDYDLIVGKGGPKISEGGVDANSPKDRDGKPATGGFARFDGPGKMQVQNMSMQQFAGLLTGPMSGIGRPVMDKTGLTGKYNFNLNWAPDFSMMQHPTGPMVAPPPPPSDQESGPTIFTAVQEQLGLKLQAGTGNIDVVVVDHVEKPSEN